MRLKFPIELCTCGKSNVGCPVHPSGAVPNAITEICGVIRLNGGREVSQSGMSADFDDYMELIDSKELKCLRDELLLLRTSCIVEVAVRNPQVADYCNHWETRAEKAESSLASTSGVAEKLAAALRKYGQHELVDGVHYCEYFNNKPCSCGFEAALAALAAY